MGESSRSSASSEGDLCIVCFHTKMEDCVLPCCHKKLCPTCKQEWREVTQAKNMPFSCPACRSKFPKEEYVVDEEAPFPASASSSSPTSPEESQESSPTTTGVRQAPLVICITMAVYTIIWAMISSVGAIVPEVLCDADFLQKVLLGGTIIHLGMIPIWAVQAYNTHVADFLKERRIVKYLCMCVYIDTILVLEFFWWMWIGACVTIIFQTYSTHHHVCGSMVSFTVLLLCELPLRFACFHSYIKHMLIF